MKFQSYIWDRENKLYVPALIYIFKNTFVKEFYLIMFLFSVIGMLVVSVVAYWNYVFMVVLTLTLYLIDRLVIKNYYKINFKRKGSRHI